MVKSIKNWSDRVRKLLYVMTKEQKIMVIILMMVVLLNAVLQTFCVYIISPLVTSMTNKELFVSDKIVSFLSVTFGTNDYDKLFGLLCIFIALLYFIKELIAVFQTWFSTISAQKVQRELSRLVLDSYMSRNYDFFLNYGTTKVMRDVKEDPTSVHNLLTCMVNLLTETVTIILLLGYIVISDWQMAICIALLAAICAVLVICGLKKKLLKSGEEARRTSAENQKVLLEAVEGVKEIQVMKKQRFFIDEFYNTYLKAQRPLIFQSIAVSAPTNVVEGVFVIGIMVFLTIKASTDSFFWNELPFLASFLVAAIRMLPAIGRVTNYVNNIQFSIPALESVYANVKIIREGKNQSSTSVSFDEKGTLEFEDKLLLTNVFYRYDDDDRYILRELDLTIKKGEFVGIIGQSGAGKSTLADIILGLHIPQRGKITIDGRNIFEIPYEYSKAIAYVPQNVYLVDGTIRENVAFGVRTEKIDEKNVIDALKKAKLYDYVMTTENGLDTIIGERGVKFSGGQRQRLAIARALYRKPQILILDEATSALDNETEAAVMEQVEEMQGTITMIIIAHRLSTIRKCDSVYEIVDGRAKKAIFE